MGQVDGKALVREYLRDVFTEGRLDRMSSYLVGESFISGVVELVTRWRSAFPDFAETVDEVYMDSDCVITVSTMTGTHEGVLQSRLGPIAPTGRRVRWTRIAVRRLDRGRFADGFFQEDEVGLLEQLGVLDLSSGTTRGRPSPLSDVRRP